jgi:hypothetical protein
MAAPLVLYSTNTWLAFQIAEQYYRRKHYVWCTPYFSGRSDKGDAGFVPPTSSPWEIYRSLFNECREGDRHSTKIEQNRSALVRGAKAMRIARVITAKRERDIVSSVERAEVRDFEPLLYVIPYGRVWRLVKEVPVRNRAHPLSREYVIESLPRRLFDVIRLKL